MIMEVVHHPPAFSRKKIYYSSQQSHVVSSASCIVGRGVYCHFHGLCQCWYRAFAAANNLRAINPNHFGGHVWFATDRKTDIHPLCLALGAVSWYCHSIGCILWSSKGMSCLILNLAVTLFCEITRHRSFLIFCSKGQGTVQIHALAELGKAMLALSVPIAFALVKDKEKWALLENLCETKQVKT